MNTENAGLECHTKGKKRGNACASINRKSLSANLSVYPSIYLLITSVLAYLRLMLTGISFSFSPSPKRYTFPNPFFAKRHGEVLRVGAIVLDLKSQLETCERKRKYTSATRSVDRFFPPGNKLNTRPFARKSYLSMRIPRGDSRELDSRERRVAELRNFIWHRAIPMHPTFPSTCPSIHLLITRVSPFGYLLRLSCHVNE